MLSVAFGEFGISPPSEALSDALYQDLLPLVEVVFYSCGGEGTGMASFLGCAPSQYRLYLHQRRHLAYFIAPFSTHLPPVAIPSLSLVDEKQNSICRFGSSFIVPIGEVSVEKGLSVRPPYTLKAQAFVLFG